MNIRKSIYSASLATLITFSSAFAVPTVPPKLEHADFRQNHIDEFTESFGRQLSYLTQSNTALARQGRSLNDGLRNLSKRQQKTSRASRANTDDIAALRHRIKTVENVRNMRTEADRDTHKHIRDEIAALDRGLTTRMDSADDRLRQVVAKVADRRETSALMKEQLEAFVSGALLPELQEFAKKINQIEGAEKKTRETLAGLVDRFETHIGQDEAYKERLSRRFGEIERRLDGYYNSLERLSANIAAVGIVSTKQHDDLAASVAYLNADMAEAQSDVLTVVGELATLREGHDELRTDHDNRVKTTGRCFVDVKGHLDQLDQGFTNLRADHNKLAKSTGGCIDDICELLAQLKTDVDKNARDFATMTAAERRSDILEGMNNANRVLEERSSDGRPRTQSRRPESSSARRIANETLMRHSM